jgi:hypothetical protein
MSNKAALAKIKQLLALSRSDNEHEAAAALAKAAALMDAHGLTDSDIALAEIDEATVTANKSVRPPKWETLLAEAVHRALKVVSFIDGQGKRTFVGRGASAEIASYAFTVLFRTLKAHRAAYIAGQLKRCSVARKRLRADVFCEGWASAVLTKIAALHSKVTEDSCIGRYLAERHPGLVEVGKRAAKVAASRVADDYWRGCAAGSAVNLNQGVGGCSAPAMLT